MAASDSNLELIKRIRSSMVICPDKINQKRHTQFFSGLDDIKNHMAKHANLIRPKFEITYEALRKLAVGLEISVPQLFTPPVKNQINGRMASTKSGQGTAHPTTTYEHELLAESLSKKKMLPYHARIRARSIEEFDGWVRHDGEEFLYVLTGVVKLFTEFYEPLEMRRGDSAYYDATMGHNVISTSEEDATILWITSLG